MLEVKPQGSGGKSARQMKEWTRSLTGLFLGYGVHAHKMTHTREPDPRPLGADRAHFPDGRSSYSHDGERVWTQTSLTGFILVVNRRLAGRSPMTVIGKIRRRGRYLSWTTALVVMACWAILSGMERTEPPAAGNVNGKKLATLDPATYVPKSLVFSSDGRHAIWLRRADGGRTQLLLDGTPGPVFDGAYQPPAVLSEDGRHVAYRVDDKKGARQFVINDGTIGPPFDHLLGMPIFSPDGRHFAYAGERKGAYQVVFDGKPSPDYELVGHLSFSPDSKRFVYAAQKDKRRFVIVDGARGPSFDDVYPAGFSPDSRHLIYYATQNYKQRLMVDGRPGAEYDAIGPVRYDPLQGGKTLSIDYVALLGHDLFEVTQPMP